MNDTLTAIYYCESYPIDRSVFAGMCLYFDEVHFVSPSDDASSKEAYTTYLSRLNAGAVRIGVFGDAEHPEAKGQIQRAAGFYQFVLDAKPLMGQVVHYHPNLQTREINRITGSLVAGGLSLDDWERFVRRGTREAELLTSFVREHPELDDAVLCRLLPTARDLASRFGYLPVSDHVALPVPVVADGSELADTLASAAGLAVLRIAVPAPLWTCADDLLEIRQKLSDEIKAYRIMTLKLAGRLRTLLRANPDTNAVRQEAEFLAKTEVLPHVADIRRRVDGETGKLWRRVFGAALRWASIGVSSYVDPTGAVLIKAIKGRRQRSRSSHRVRTGDFVSWRSGHWPALSP
jgi:hypothetical protein